MVLLWAVVLGVVLGFIRGGNIKQLGNLQLQAPWLIAIALGIQLLIFPTLGGQALIKFGSSYFHFLSYFCLACFILANWKNWEIPLMGVGMVLNLMAITANGGYMPASVSALKKVGQHDAAQYLVKHGKFGNVVRAGPNTVLDFLGDYLYIPQWIPLSSTFSIGDSIVALGLILLLSNGMVKKSESITSKAGPR